MYFYRQHIYEVYIVTNPQRTVLYVGVTNNLPQRLIEHWQNRGVVKTFAGKYHCYNLLYYEEHSYILNAIAREKEIKGWRREKKMNLIIETNPELKFLNDIVCRGWPPKGIRPRY